MIQGEGLLGASGRGWFRIEKESANVSLTEYFSNLLRRVEESDEISNAGKDEGGFYRPSRTILIRHLNLLRDLHGKPMAHQMVKHAWEAVVKDLPPEWLVMNDNDQREFRQILEGKKGK